MTANYERVLNQYYDVIGQLSIGQDAAAAEEERQAALAEKAAAAAEAKRREDLAAAKAAELANADNETKITMFTEEINGYQTQIDEIYASMDSHRAEFEAAFLVTYPVEEYGAMSYGYYDEVAEQWVDGNLENEYHEAEHEYYLEHIVQLEDQLYGFEEVAE
jgi:hypothetical protein